MGGYRGSFAWIISNSDRLLGFARGKDNKSLCLANELVDYQVTLRKGYEKLSQAYILLLEDIPDDPDDDGRKAKTRYESGRDEIDERYMDLNVNFLEALAKIQKPLPENQLSLVHNPMSMSTANDKAAMQLKPFTLLREHTPTELTDWLDRFRDFYNASNLGAKDIPGQQSYFKLFIKPNLYMQIRPKITAGTAIYATDANPDPCCIDLLKDEFLIHYPLTVRRLDFFKLAQTKGQLFTDFYAKLSGMGELADLAGIEIEDMMVFRIIVALHDDKLRQLILRLPELTLTEVMREARAYESASTTTKHVDGAAHAGRQPAEAKAAFHQKGKGKGEGKSSKACPWCGGGHPYDKERKNCPALEAICKNCKKTGHFTKACKHPKSSGDNPKPDKSGGGSGSKVSVCRTVRYSQSSGSRPTPLMIMTFEQEKGTEFRHQILPDTGATRTIISHNLVNENGMKMDDMDELLFNASGQPMKVKGRIWCQVSYGVTGRSHKVELESSDWISRGLFVVKPNGKSLRLVSTIPS
jgi:hypothetical protein